MAVEAYPVEKVDVLVVVEVARVLAIAVTVLGAGDGPKIAGKGIGVGWW